MHFYKRYSMRWVTLILSSLLVTAAVATGAFATPYGADGSGHHGVITRIGDSINRSGDAPRKVFLAPQTTLAMLEKATLVGHHAPSSTIQLVVGLKLRNVDHLKTFLRQLQNPASPEYHRFLTPAQFTARYGPTAEQVQEVVRFLERKGIQVEHISPNNMLITTEASTKAYEHAFGIMINDYRMNGRSFFSTADRPRFPASLAGDVANIVGLDNSIQMHPHHHLEPLAASASKPRAAAPPPSTTYYNPLQIATAYDWPSITDPNNGAGVTIAILTAASSGLENNTDYRHFWNAWGLPDHTVNVIYTGEDYGATGGMLETMLDVTWSGAMSPGATLDVYVAPNASFLAFTEMFNRFVTDNNAQVMSTSWGAPEVFYGSMETDHQIFMQAAAQGISMFAAAGDAGSSDCRAGSCPPGDNNADYPSSDPFITAANGTELELSDVEGHYGSETTWNCFGKCGTGGAVSRYFSEPVWQTGSGVPENGWRNNSDIAMNAGGVLYLLYFQGIWGSVGGTSAVAPQLAGLFAIAVSDNSGKRVGQSNSLIYNDVNAGNYATDFHDVKTGNNGKFSAGLGWDHPTGWGSPVGTNLVEHIGTHGATGTLDGKVTDDQGNPVSGARISVNGTYRRATDEKGDYSFTLPPGTYTVTATAFPYATGTATAVTVTDGGTVSQDFSLNAAPRVKVSGHIRDDGAAHGYGLYGKITATVTDTPAGYGKPGYVQVASVWTDPATGAYSLSLPEGYSYKLVAGAAFIGYDNGTVSLAKLSGSADTDFALSPDGSCTAPGYAVAFGEDFNDNPFPPDGWRVSNDVEGSTVVWGSNQYWNEGNVTGGSGMSAAADSSLAGQAGYLGPYDTSLITPPIPVSRLEGASLLRFRLNFQVYSKNDALDVDISGDDGASWTTLAHLQTNYGGRYQAGGASYQVPLAIPSGASDVLLRWRYYDKTGGFDWYAQIDDVSIGRCKAVAGGLVVGTVTAGTDGSPLLRASVGDDRQDTTESFENPGDPDTPAGYYILFAQAGERTITASAPNYTKASAQLRVSEGSIAVRDFSLASARLSATPSGLTVAVPAGTQVQKTLTIANSGLADGNFRILSFDAAPPPEESMAGMQEWIKCANPTPLQLTAFGPGNAALSGCDMGHAARAISNGGAWIPLPYYPGGILDNAAAADTLSGKLYSVGGLSTATGTVTWEGHVYDPVTHMWSAIAHMPKTLDAPVAAFIGGKLYVTAGWDMSGGASETLAIYDPGTDTWSSASPDPAPEGGGASVAVLNGKMYVIGGCPGETSAICGDTAVEAYDPATDGWSEPGSLAPYPHPVSWQACGTVGGKIYCAGGVSGGQLRTEYADGYVYDPAKNKWSAIAKIPVPAHGGPHLHRAGLWGSAYAGTARGLVISGGVTHGWITNQGWIYSPTANQWTPLPYAPTPVYRAGSACGLYVIGGQGAAGVLASAELLPGHNACGTSDIPWLTVSPGAGTVAAGGSTSVTLTFDGTGKKPSTTSTAYLLLSGNEPYAPKTIPLAVTWKLNSADVGVTGLSDATLQQGESRSFDLSVKNIGPGTAVDAVLEISVANDHVELVSTTGEAAQCALQGSGASCDLGDISAGGETKVTVKIFGNSAGTTMLEAEVQSATDDPNGGNNQTHAQIEVKATSNGGGNNNDGGGGGAFGWFALATLLGLALAGVKIRNKG